MSDMLKVKFKIGEIEFEAEGLPKDVSNERNVFMNTLLPAAVEAMIRTRGSAIQQDYLDGSSPVVVSSTPMIGEASQAASSEQSVNEFLNQKNFSSQIDTALGLIYYNEIFRKRSSFSSEDLKQYFKEAKTKVPANVSDVINKLVGKSQIMPADEKGFYQLTRTGKQSIELYEGKPKKENKRTALKKGHTKPTVSSYLHITADDLNLKSYPAVKDLKGSKEQVIVAMYILTAEVNAEWFNWADLEYILENIFEVPANKKTIYGMFDKVKSWFKAEPDPATKNGVRRKLLSGAKDFAKNIIEQSK